MASRWFLRNVSHRFTGSGSLGARRIHRDTLLSETSKPSLRTVTAARGEDLSVEYLFHHDQRFDDKVPDFWVLRSEIEECKRPTNSEVMAVNRLIK